MNSQGLVGNFGSTYAFALALWVPGSILLMWTSSGFQNKWNFRGTITIRAPKSLWKCVNRLSRSSSNFGVNLHIFIGALGRRFYTTDMENWGFLNTLNLRGNIFQEIRFFAFEKKRNFWINWSMRYLIKWAVNPLVTPFWSQMVKDGSDLSI